MDNEEVEFIAENELITVIPNFQYKTFYLIGVSKYQKKLKYLIIINKREILVHLSLVYQLKFLCGWLFTFAKDKNVVSNVHHG